MSLHNFSKCSIKNTKWKIFILYSYIVFYWQDRNSYQISKTWFHVKDGTFKEIFYNREEKQNMQ